MLTFYKKYWKTAFDIALIVLTVYLIMVAFSFLYRIATPVFLSFVIFMMIEPLAKRLNRIGLKKSIASAISILVFSLVIVGAFLLAGFVLTNEIMSFANNLPQYQSMLISQVEQTTAFLTQQFQSLPPDVVNSLNDMVNSVTQWGSGVASSFLMSLVGFLTSFSAFMFNFIIGIVLAYFLSIEIKDWKKIAQDKTPNTFKTAFFFLRDNVFRGIGAYLMAQLKLISVTFIVILIALLILGVESAFAIAVLSAVFDVLPLLGVSTVFIPWIIYLFIVGNTSLAIWLSVLLLVVILTRQVLEPKITGDTLGVSAFTMLVFMIISLSLFGVAGVILSPILVILIKALYDQGYLKRWIRKPQGEYDDKPQPPSNPDGPQIV
ncbi:sporulation integral membrane protein YtvI [Paenibacillus abyssi]|uniref:Sporulation integral membrane protein YtvI n=1 Tax=Paenibacillus abyssi TaxID=1340531 RepID=A0A917G2G3_9BACL|nr:sporulation integral membrane protein YtvI [Paenibacillus abyssi]GGG19724.1 sporulation integral membrane protein YtvI [Paenibacillus abyssi]